MRRDLFCMTCSTLANRTKIVPLLWIGAGWSKLSNHHNQLHTKCIIQVNNVYFMDVYTNGQKDFKQESLLIVINFFFTKNEWYNLKNCHTNMKLAKEMIVFMIRCMLTVFARFFSLLIPLTLYLVSLWVRHAKWSRRAEYEI